MNDIKDICDDLLAAAPPPPDSTAVLTAARRSATRHRTTVAAGVGTLVLVVTGGTALALRPATVDTPAQQPPPAVAAPATQPSSAPAAASQVPPAARAAYTHGATMRGLLLAAVPAGYATEDYPTSRDKDLDADAVLPNAKYPAPADGMLSVAFGGLLLQSGGGEGMLTASIWATARALPTEECPPASCEVVTAAGVSVEVRTWSDEGGRHISATRRLTGGWLMVIASQGMGTAGTETPLDGVRNQHPRVKPALPDLPFTTQQIAALALNPAMLQFP
jgi:hypothetical protein